MLAVSNTSPICNLAIIGHLDLLKARYKQVLIPPAVAQELAALRHPAAKVQISTAQTEGWLKVQTPAGIRPPKTISLDDGELEAIALALSVQSDVLLMDEKRGRQAARQQGLRVAGVLGELLYARRNRIIPSLRAAIDQLRIEANFFVDGEIERFILSQAGE